MDVLEITPCDVGPVNIAWDTLASFMACHGGDCVLNNFYPTITTIRAHTEVYGAVDGCVIVWIYSSLQDGNDVIYGVIVPPTRRGPRYIDAPFSEICFQRSTLLQYRKRPSVSQVLLCHKTQDMSGRCLTLQSGW